MKLVFNKKDFCGFWKEDDFEDDDFTEKVPPDTGHVFSEDLGEWVLPKNRDEGTVGGTCNIFLLGN